MRADQQEAILANGMLLNYHAVSPYVRLCGRHNVNVTGFENPAASEVHEGGKDASMRLSEIAVILLMEASFPPS